MGRVQRATVRAGLLIGAASVAGVLLREAVTVGFRRTGASRLTAVPPSLGANLLGSFALGGMHSAGDYAAPCVRAGLSTGFAGALTSAFSAFAWFHASRCSSILPS